MHRPLEPRRRPRPPQRPRRRLRNTRLPLVRSLFSGQLDAYYGLNFNHPSSDMNDLYNFDVRANRPDINLAKITAQHDPDPIGFRFDLGFGKAFRMMHSTETAPKFFDHVEQMFVSFKPKSAKVSKPISDSLSPAPAPR
jgi:hypothetical protein